MILRLDYETVSALESAVHLAISRSMKYSENCTKMAASATSPERIQELKTLASHFDEQCNSYLDAENALEEAIYENGYK